MLAEIVVSELRQRNVEVNLYKKQFPGIKIQDMSKPCFIPAM